MTYTIDQILTACHSGDDGLASYYLSTLGPNVLRAYARQHALR
jgi:hypothetical protein